MFYENERIVRKQIRYINSKAKEMIDNFRSKGMNDEEIVAALELLLGDKEGSELHRDTVKRALTILKKKDKDE